MPPKSSRVLIAEDDEASASAMKLVLEDAGISCELVNNGKAMITKLAQDQDFGLIILDLLIPEMNGFEVMEQLQKAGNEVPILVISNLSQLENISRAKKLGAIDFIIKANISLKDLVMKVQQILA